MTSFSFIHAADIHLDSPLSGLEQYEGAPVEKIRNATREAFKNLVDTAIERKTDFVIIAGDLYDGDWKDFNTGLFFVSQMVRLQKANIPVYLIRGNHDAKSMITRELKLPDNVYEFSTRNAETFVLSDFGVAIHGQGFAKRSVTENLVKNYPPCKENYFNIGILHTSATGREGHENYAPCSVEDMKEKGYDYWALGHIHRRELLHERNPVILFPGNIQGRHIRETGNKGCTYVEVKDGTIDSLEHIPLDVLRWEICEIDAQNVNQLDDLLHVAREQLTELYDEAEGRPLAVRIILSGATELHQQLLAERDELINNLRSLALEIGFGDIWIEKVKIRTTGKLQMEEMKTQNTPVAAILDFIDEASRDSSILEELLEEFSDIQKALPPELKQGEEAFDFTNAGALKKRIKEAEDLILYYLSVTGVEGK